MCEIRYDAEVVGLDIDEGRFLSATVRRGAGTETVRAGALVAASGGFEANIEWLREYWGPPADNFLIRGTPYNRGTVLKMLMDQGVQSVGDPTQCHAVAIDARAPKFDGGIITRLDCVVFGIVVNKHAERFYDEGEDIWPKRYAIWGRLVAAQPDQIAYILFDAPVAHAVHAVAVPADPGRTPSANSPASSSSTRRRSRRPSPGSTPPSAPARSTTRSWTIAAPRG